MTYNSVQGEPGYYRKGVNLTEKHFYISAPDYKSLIKL